MLEYVFVMYCMYSGCTYVGVCVCNVLHVRTVETHYNKSQGILNILYYRVAFRGVGDLLPP